jgi:hypothetical protein
MTQVLGADLEPALCRGAASSECKVRQIDDAQGEGSNGTKATGPRCFLSGDRPGSRRDQEHRVKLLSELPLPYQGHLKQSPIILTSHN